MSPHVKQALTDIAAQVLDVSAAQAATADLRGLDAGTAVRMTEAVNGRFGTALPTSAVTAADDLDALAVRVEAQLAAQEPADAVAVIGMHCRTAGADDPDQLWEVIREGRDRTTEVTDPVALALFREHFPDAAPPRYGAMAGTELFDPAFFRISPREAAAMDAAQRVLLESSYHALEDAALDASTLQGRAVATIVGSTGLAPQAEYSAHALMGADTSIMAARLAYHLDLAGPALTVDTACSSSLVAVDIARRLLLSGEADLALAGGVYVANHPGTFVTMEALGTVSPNRSCRPFDADADGMLLGEGVGVVVLKRLSDAVRDHDRILGVIRGSGTNQDGRTSGITSPSSSAQRDLLRAVYRRAGIGMDRLGYIEAHGTGTSLGDPIEVQGLIEAFEEFTDRREFCALGSVKANIGHTMGAAGVLGLIKVLLCLRHAKLPPAANFRTENKHADFAGAPVRVSRELADWTADDGAPRLAGVSSFGYSGTNAHVIVEEYPEPVRRTGSRRRRQLVPLSARGEEQLRAKAGALAARLRSGGLGDADLPDLAHTLQVGREAFAQRLAVCAGSAGELADRLAEFAADGSTGPFVHRGEAPERGGRGREDRPAGRDLDALAAAWVTGADVDWARLHTGTLPRRIGLPPHPFEREAFPHVWAQGTAGAPTPGGTVGAVEAPGADGAVPSVLSALDAAADAQLRDDPKSGDLEAAHRSEVMVRELATVCRTLLFASLRRMDAFAAAGERHRPEELARRLDVVPEYRPLFRELLAVLTDAGLLRTEGDDLVTTGRVTGPDVLDWTPEQVAAVTDEVVARYPEMAGYARLLTLCLADLPEVLTGRRKAHEVLFPDGSFDAVEAVYHSDHDTNGLVARLVAEYVRARRAADPGASVSVLEIGAGTGGTTAKVLPALDGAGGDLAYVYTDISRGFTQYGRSRYGADHPYVDFRPLDIEQPPAGQGFAPGTHDVVLACNVLHATRRIDDTLAHARQLLRPGGVLIVLETTRKQDFFTLTFGLMSGWWAAEDDGRIPGSPLLSVPLWRQALERSGFRGVRSLSPAPVREDRAFQAVVLAEKEGAMPAATVPVTAEPVAPVAEPAVEPAAAPAAEATAEAAVQAAAGADGEAAFGSPLQQRVAAAWQEVLGLASVRPDDDFQEVGGDSIMLTQIISRLKSGFPVELDLGELFQARTLADMAGLLEAELIDKIDQLPDDAVNTLLA
ncbi:beta-ketoacyl synthase N-terminal-like domain-containing protein [Streptomyces sp. NPDC046942]|uniref:beta-ketoacyl synthase N-terminal-like domain-containing protein n=1 Tax=Streptomyces sp. NPDC046942 TaxID=3155137 RepID=UPI00340BFD49